MLQHERSARSRRVILAAALKLFSSQGFRATRTREIADAAGVSIGAVYHQFPDKEDIFRSLLDEFWEAIGSREFPLYEAMLNGAFPDDLLGLGHAARASVKKYRRHIALIYVDVIEFEGHHIKRFYEQMVHRFQDVLDQFPDVQRKLRPDVSPLTAALLVSRLMLYFYSVVYVFKVPNHFGKDEETVLREIVGILEHGIKK
jgi:AcrR family transcriptional regulator